MCAVFTSPLFVFGLLQDPLTEHAAYEQMALFASACAFSWSKWNAKCGAERVVMQVLLTCKDAALLMFLLRDGCSGILAVAFSCTHCGGLLQPLPWWHCNSEGVVRVAVKAAPQLESYYATWVVLTQAGLTFTQPQACPADIRVKRVNLSS